MQTLLDLRGSIPVFVEITEGCTHDVNVLDSLRIEAGAYYVMDKGYTDFKRLYEKIHKQQSFFVTRSKDNINYEVVETREVDTNCGVFEDISIRLTGLYTVQKYPEELRMVTYEDFSDGESFTTF